MWHDIKCYFKYLLYLKVNCCYISIGSIIRFLHFYHKRMIFDTINDNIIRNILRAIVISISSTLCLLLVFEGENPRFYSLLVKDSKDSKTSVIPVMVLGSCSSIIAGALNLIMWIYNKRYNLCSHVICIKF